MKRILSFTFILISIGCVHAQDIFRQHGFKKEALTLSKGRYPETFNQEKTVQIGTVLLDTRSGKIVCLLPDDTTAAAYQGEISSRFLSIDPLCEKYPWISPYAYCMNNPLKFIDPDGRDGMVTGNGTQTSPYVITANYYFQNGTLNETQINALNSAINDYNKLGGNNGIKIENKNGSISYVKFNLNAQGVDNVAKAVTGDVFTITNGQDISYGNAIGLEPNNSDGFGAANGWHVNINPENLIKGIDAGFNESKLTKATYMHEIGHNLGLDHNDKTRIMQNAVIIETNQLGNNTVIYNYPNMDKKAVQIMINRINRPRNNSLGVLIKK